MLDGYSIKKASSLHLIAKLIGHPRSFKKTGEVVVLINLECPALKHFFISFGEQSIKKRKECRAPVGGLFFWKRKGNRRQGWVGQIGGIVIENIFSELVFQHTGKGKRINSISRGSENSGGG